MQDLCGQSGQKLRRRGTILPVPASENILMRGQILVQMLLVRVQPLIFTHHKPAENIMIMIPDL
jgi:hypothetical protein